MFPIWKYPFWFFSDCESLSVHNRSRRNSLSPLRSHYQFDQLMFWKTFTIGQLLNIWTFWSWPHQIQSWSKVIAILVRRPHVTRVWVHVIMVIFWRLVRLQWQPLHPIHNVFDLIQLEMYTHSIHMKIRAYCVPQHWDRLHLAVEVTIYGMSTLPISAIWPICNEYEHGHHLHDKCRILLNVIVDEKVSPPLIFQFT